MLRISSSETEDLSQCAPNLLPCRVHQNGPVNASQKYWSPEISKDGTPEAYFRGRKLRGKELKLPTSYQGLIVEEVDTKQQHHPIPEAAQMSEQEKDEEGGKEMKTLQAIGAFDEVMLWGHDSTVSEDDTFIKGVGEWIAFAETVSAPCQMTTRLLNGEFLDPQVKVDQGQNTTMSTERSMGPSLRSKLTPGESERAIVQRGLAKHKGPFWRLTRHPKRRRCAPAGFPL